MWWITAICLSVKGIWSHLKIIRALEDVQQASETSHSKSSLGKFQHQYLTKLLVDVYSYHLMEKSVSCCCVHGSWLSSNPVTNDYDMNEIRVTRATAIIKLKSSLKVKIDVSVHINLQHSYLTVTSPVYIIMYLNHISYVNHKLSV